MQTTYFARAKNLDPSLNLVSIALNTPPGFPGKRCFSLAPTSFMFYDLKDTEDTETFTKRFKTKLSNLDPHKLVEQYGEDAIWICYEGDGKFCHRHLVSDWFREAGYEISELQV